MSKQYKIDGINLTQESIDYVLHLFNLGNDAQAISEHTGRSFWTILAILNQFGE